MLQSEYDVIVRHKRLKVLLIILTAIAVALVLYAVIKVGREHFQTVDTPVKTVAPLVSSPEPKKTDFGTDFPADFPADIPVEKDVKFTQSYSLDYPEQKQLSIVFPSTKTVKENYHLYKDYAEKHGWIISNSGEKSDIAVLYAVKEGMDMNVTILEGTPTSTEAILPGTDSDTKDKPLPPSKSQVSISVLRK